MDTATQVDTTKSTPLVSIIMLTYNRAHFIKDAIASVLAQSYTNIELHIIDDGSEDDTELVIQSFADHRLVYERHEHAGLATRRARSLDSARGAYIAILDSDDIWLDTDKLKKQVAYLEENPDCVLVGTFIKRISISGIPLGSGSYHTSDAEIRSHILSRNQFAHSSVVIRSKALEKIGTYRPLPIGEDLDLFLRLGQEGKFANLTEFSVAYRQHGTSATNNKIDTIKAVLEIIKTYKNDYPGYVLAYIKYKTILSLLSFLALVRR